MIVGLTISEFALLHTIISLVAIATGLIVLIQLIVGKDTPALTYVFLSTSAATSITGFLFPFSGITPGIFIGIVSLKLLGFALGGYLGARVDGWRIVYVITATIALYLNVFVLVVQSFQKIPSLHALAPTQSEPAFGFAQLSALVAFVFLGWWAVPGSRGVFHASVRGNSRNLAEKKIAKWTRKGSPVQG